MHWRAVSMVVSVMCEVMRMGVGVLHRQTAQRDTDDCRSCLECSRDNGCVRCPERLFLFLQRDGMSQHGTCLLTCPAGHYEQKGKDMNRCLKCRSLDCEHCFSRDFCTKCKAGFQLYKGKCLSRCPLGTFPHHTDCLDHCLLASLGEWSEWSMCQRDGATCGYRWGKQSRTRGTSDNHTTSFCPLQAETQRCKLKKRCTPPKKEGGKKKKGLGLKRERKRKRQERLAAKGLSANLTTAGGSRLRRQ
ncbi:R-spondin-4 [Periophthalmus magnuspinnatus]|uniref:R-spondin-4 n=1 Tax=Periophthalmus magnuspinnatus TaxID=409849 RepID=UPI002436F1EC|nr:R-spondin-4 [Periophthalmus magnuspinnatus]